MAGEIESLSNSLKNFYPDKAFQAMLNLEVPLRKMMKANPYRVGDGGIVKFLAYMDTAQNVSQIADGGDLPTPGERTEDQFTLNPSLFSGTFQIGEVTKGAANTNKSAFNSGELTRRIEETAEDIAKRINVVYSGTHGTGRLGRVLTDGASNFVADVPEGVQLFRVNMPLEARDLDVGGAIRDSFSNQKITAIDIDTRTVTYAGTNRTLVAGDSVYVFGTYGIRNANGLRGLVDDGTFLTTVQGLSRTTYPKLKAVVKGNSGTLRNLTEQILVNACHDVRQRTGKKISHIMTNTGQIEKYIEFVSPDRRFNVTGSTPPTYVTGYNEGGLVHVAPGINAKIEINYDIVAREIYLLSMDTFFHYEAVPLSWWDKDGSILKPTPGTTGNYKASYIASIRSVENIGCDMPLANCVIRDLRDPLIADA